MQHDKAVLSTVEKNSDILQDLQMQVAALIGDGYRVLDIVLALIGDRYSVRDVILSFPGRSFSFENLTLSSINKSNGSPTTARIL